MILVPNWFCPTLVLVSVMFSYMYDVIQSFQQDATGSCLFVCWIFFVFVLKLLLSFMFLLILL